VSWRQANQEFARCRTTSTFHNNERDPCSSVDVRGDRPRFVNSLLDFLFRLLHIDIRRTVQSTPSPLIAKRNLRSPSIVYRGNVISSREGRHASKCYCPIVACLRRHHGNRAIVSRRDRLHGRFPPAGVPEEC